MTVRVINFHTTSVIITTGFTANVALHDHQHDIGSTSIMISVVIIIMIWLSLSLCARRGPRAVLRPHG